MHYALNLRDKYLIKLICVKKADQNIKNNNDLTPSIQALRTGDKEIIYIMSKPKRKLKDHSITFQKLLIIKIKTISSTFSLK